MGIKLILIGIIGFINFIRKNSNYLLAIASIEIILLAIAYIIAIYSINLDDIIGQIYILYILGIAAAEVAIGLSILVTMSRIRGSIISPVLFHSQ